MMKKLETMKAEVAEFERNSAEVIRLAEEVKKLSAFVPELRRNKEVCELLASTMDSVIAGTRSAMDKMRMSVRKTEAMADSVFGELSADGLAKALKAQIRMDIVRENEQYGEDFNEPLSPDSASDSEPAVEEFSVRKFLKDTYEEVFCGLIAARPVIRCRDGFTVSVQASANHYCIPRKNLPDGSYEKVELGCLSEADDLVQEYAEDPGEPETVYGYVPVSVAEELIRKHGGVV